MVDLSNYKAVIVAGGKGTRLYPITKEIPKPLIPVCKKPIINYLVNLFRSYGIKDIAVIINKTQAEEFKWWKKRYYPSTGSGQVLNIKFFEESEPMGTFGMMWNLKKWVGKSLIFFTNGDEIKEIELEEMANFHNKMNAIATIALVRVPDPQHYGVAICNKGKIKEFIEKPEIPPAKYVNSGFYILSPKVFDYHPGPKFVMIEKDIFPKLAADSQLAGYKFKGTWMDCGTWERYEKALDFFK